MPPQPTTQPTSGMDNDVVNLAKAIRQTESGGNFSAKGGSGESGAYQWMPDTWKAHAKQALGNENAEMTPSNQNAVAYTVLKSWKDQGLNPAQIAAKWNSGSETGWENKRGVNSAGVQYDVPKYVKSVTDAYQTVKAGGSAFIDPNNPSSTAAPQPEQGSFLGGLVKSIVSPVATMLARPFQAGAELLGASADQVDQFSQKYSGGLVAPVPRSFGDVKQDVGRGMQTAAMGLGPVSGGAMFGTGMSLEEGNDLFSKDTALYGGLGLAGGKLLDLVGKPLLNSAGKAIGVITPTIIKEVAGRGAGAVEKFMAQHSILPNVVSTGINKGAQILETGANAPFKAAGDTIKKPFTTTPDGVVAGRLKELEALEKKYAGMRKAAQFSKDGGKASRERIANTDVLVGSVDADGKISTMKPGGAHDQYKTMYVDEGESVVRDLLEKEARSVELAKVEANLRREIMKSGLAGRDLMNALKKMQRELDGYKLKADADGRVRLTDLHDSKIGTTKQINFATPPEKASYRKAIARGLKKTIEKNSGYNIRETNAELAKFYEDLNFIEMLDGKIASGGRLGKYFAQIAGNIAGGVTGGMAGGMTGSAIGTIVGGEIASRIRGLMLSRSLGGIAGKAGPKSEILERAIAESKKPRLMLPAPRDGAYRSEIKASKPISLSSKTETTRQAEENLNEKIQTTAKGYKSEGKVEIKGIDQEGNIQIIDKGNVVVIPADELPVIQMGKKAKSKDDGLPTIQLDDQRSRKGTQNNQKIASPIKKPNTISNRVQEPEKKSTEEYVGKSVAQIKAEEEEIMVRYKAAKSGKEKEEITKEILELAKKHYDLPIEDKIIIPTKGKGVFPRELYHGTNKDDVQSIIKYGFDTSKTSRKAIENPKEVFLSNDKTNYHEASALRYGDTIIGVRVKKGQNLNLLDEEQNNLSFGLSRGSKDSQKIVQMLKERGFDGSIDSSGEYRIWSPEKLEAYEIKKGPGRASDLKKKS